MSLRCKTRTANSPAPFPLQSSHLNLIPKTPVQTLTTAQNHASIYPHHPFNPPKRQDIHLPSATPPRSAIGPSLRALAPPERSILKHLKPPLRRKGSLRGARGSCSGGAAAPQGSPPFDIERSLSGSTLQCSPHPAPLPQGQRRWL